MRMPRLLSFAFQFPDKAHHLLPAAKVGITQRQWCSCLSLCLNYLTPVVVSALPRELYHSKFSFSGCYKTARGERQLEITV